MTHAGGYSADPRIRWIEWTPFVAAAPVLPAAGVLPLGARILIYILYALSLDLILGYAGIVTLGHSAFFGVGRLRRRHTRRQGRHHRSARAARGRGARGRRSLGIATGAVILRTTGLTLLMLTLAIASLCLEIANRATPHHRRRRRPVGYRRAPMLGRSGSTCSAGPRYVYCLVDAVRRWLVVRRPRVLPVRRSLAGIRREQRAHARDRRTVYARLVTVYTMSAMIAGIAGALLTQTNQFVGLNVLGFEAAGELLVMLILGGVGRLYGAFVGPVVYLIAQDWLAKQFPEYWYFGIGLLLVRRGDVRARRHARPRSTASLARWRTA